MHHKYLVAALSLLGCAAEVDPTPESETIAIAVFEDCPTDERLLMASAKKSRALRAMRGPLSGTVDGFDGRRPGGYPTINDMLADDTGGELSSEQGQRETNLGAEVRLTSQQFITNPGGVFGNWNQISTSRQRLLSADPKDMPLKRFPGSWVLSLAGRIIDPGPSNPGITKAAPVVAYIGFGKGGVVQEVEVDAWRNVIALPADTTYVDIAYNQYGLPGGIPGLAPNEVFREIAVKGTIHRSLETGEAIPTRSYYFAPNNGNLFPVPPFATSWTIIPNAGQVTNGSLPYTVDVLTADTTSGGLIVDHPLDEVVESMARTFCFRPLPAGATNLRVTVNGQQSAFSGKLIYRLGL